MARRQGRKRDGIHCGRFGYYVRHSRPALAVTFAHLHDIQPSHHSTPFESSFSIAFWHCSIAWGTWRAGQSGQSRRADFAQVRLDVRFAGLNFDRDALAGPLGEPGRWSLPSMTCSWLMARPCFSKCSAAGRSSTDARGWLGRTGRDRCDAGGRSGGQGRIIHTGQEGRPAGGDCDRMDDVGGKMLADGIATPAGEIKR